MKKTILISLILVGIGGAILGNHFLLGGDEDTWICEDEGWVKHGNPSAPMPTERCGEEQLIGGDKDEGGCLIGAGYSWCESKQKCLREWEEPCNSEKTDQELIKEALVEKNNWSAEEIKVTISQNDGKYATGGAGANDPRGGGGIWFAVKADGNWEIVWDGNGAIMCEDLTSYPDFPIDLIPECYDSTINKMVKR